MPDAARQYGVHHAPAARRRPSARDRGSLSAPRRDEAQIGRERLAGLGVETRVFPTADPDRDEPASPAARAADIEDAFADPEIGAVMAYTGGDDQIRVLRHLDGDALAASPTRFSATATTTTSGCSSGTAGSSATGSASTRTSSATPISTPTPSGTSVARCLRSRSAGSCPPTSGPTTGSTSRLASPAGGTIPRPDDVGGAGGDSAEPVRGRVWGRTFAIVKWHLQTDRYLPAPDRLDGAVLALETSEDVPPPRGSATRFARWVSAGC